MRSSPRGEYPAWEALDWHDEALCSRVDPGLFHTAREGDGHRNQDVRVRAAKAVCGGCPVRLRCLQWALDGDDRWAILGGTTPTERAAMVGRARVS